MLALALLTLAYGPGPASDLESRVREIFDESCTACHDASSDDVVLEGSLDHLQAPGSTGVPLVAPGDPEGSYLYQKMLGHEGIEGDPMPMGEDPLPPEQLAAVRDWIASLQAAPEAEPAPAPAEGGGEELEGMVAAIFEDNCASCHGEESDHVRLIGDLGHLRTTTAGAFPLVSPGDPDHSYLYMKLVGADGIKGSQMPMGEDPLPAAMLEDIRAWIEQMPAVEEAPPDDGPAPMPTPTRRQRPAFGGTHQIALHTTTTLGKRTLEFRVHHRFAEIGRPFHGRTFFGLANPGAVISLGVAYGIVDGLDALLRFTNDGPSHELGVKYVPLRQESGAPLSLGFFGSYEQTWSDPLKGCVEESNCIRANGQVMVSRLWFDRWATQVNVGYSALTNPSGEIEIEAQDGTAPTRYKDNRGTLDVGLASTVFLDKKRKWGLDVEYFLPLPIIASDPAKDPFYFNGIRSENVVDRMGGWALGFSVRTGLHFFQVFASNVQHIHTGLAAPGGSFGTPFDKDGAHFLVGFNLSRKWNL